jgi:hypothetical protein
MAAPLPAKKQKLANLEPVIFKQAGLGAPDTCLAVFDQEFYLHSTILKLYSAFFRKFMDSPDKVKLTTTATEFKYNWVSKVEKDDDWHLVVPGIDQVSYF